MKRVLVGVALAAIPVLGADPVAGWAAGGVECEVLGRTRSEARGDDIVRVGRIAPRPGARAPMSEFGEKAAASRLRAAGTIGFVDTRGGRLIGYAPLG